MNRLKIVRELAGYTQEQVATAHDVTAQTIQRFEKGTRNVSLSWLEKLAQFYKVRVSTLVDDVVEAEIDEALMREIMAYTFKRCEGENVDVNKLAKVVTRTYKKCRKMKEAPKLAEIREKVDDMLTCAID